MTIDQVFANRIKSKLSTLGESFLQRDYLKEAHYLLNKWPEFKEPHELVAWSMAKDFSTRFKRHSYEEWAYVFGIPRTHTLLSFALHPKIVEARRRRVIFLTYGIATLAAILFILILYCIQ